MQDYMKALHLRFKGPLLRSQELEREVAVLHKQLSSRLGKPERKLLLRLIDLEDTLRGQTNLDSFISGFRLANGIHQELSEHPPYSFEKEEERKVYESFEREEE